MFNQLEGMQFSEVNRAMVTIEQLHLQPVAIHSEGTLPAGNVVPPLPPTPAPSTLITVAFTAAMHSEGVLPAGNAVPPSTFMQLIVVLFVSPESFFSGNCLLLIFLS